MSAVDIEALFKQTMASLAAGVTVVTGMDPQGEPRGLTVTSIASYSGAPPSVIVCVEATSSSYRALTEGEHFAVNLLQGDQSEVATLFASKAPDKFARRAWNLSGEGVPILEGALAHLVCRRSFTAEHGDHAVVIGDIVDGRVDDSQPLIYWRRGFYSGLGADADAAARSGGKGS